MTAKWLVGCDGAHSRVREAAGIDSDGGTHVLDFDLADVHMAWPVSREEVSRFFSTEGFVMVARSWPTFPRRARRWLANWPNSIMAEGQRTP